MLGALRRARPLPLLRLLGAHARADVPHHRRLGRPRRIYAAIKFVLYTMAGSLLMLVAILYLAWHAGQRRGRYDLRLRAGSPGSTSAPREQLWLFAAFALAFAIKVPMFPLHTWLPDAHVEAPTAGR
jgi:NADH-quinone oxidoreductase subunit M